MEATAAHVAVQPLELVPLEHAGAAGDVHRQVHDPLRAFDAVVLGRARASTPTARRDRRRCDQSRPPARPGPHRLQQQLISATACWIIGWYAIERVSPGDDFRFFTPAIARSTRALGQAAGRCWRRSARPRRRARTKASAPASPAGTTRAMYRSGTKAPVEDRVVASGWRACPACPRSPRSRSPACRAA